jgi:hypothetical protein
MMSANPQTPSGLNPTRKTKPRRRAKERPIRALPPTRRGPVTPNSEGHIVPGCKQRVREIPHLKSLVR